MRGTWICAAAVFLVVGFATLLPLPAGTKNDPPVAVAGPDVNVTIGQAVAFDGSASYDPDGDMQFVPDRVLSDPATRFTDNGALEWGPSVGVDASGTVHVAWTSWNGSEYSVLYLRIENGSVNAPRKIDGPESGMIFWTSLVVDGRNRIHISWVEARPNEGRCPCPAYSRSDDGGHAFSAPVLIYDGYPPGGAERVRMAVDDSGVAHFVWGDFQSRQRMLYSRSTGSNFTPPRVLYETDHLGGIEDFRADSAGRLHIAWGEFVPNRASDIFYFRLDPNGTFVGPIQMSDSRSDTDENNPTLYVDSAGTVSAMWGDSRNSPGSPRLFFGTLAANAPSFGPSRQIVSFPSDKPRLVGSSGGLLHVCFNGDEDPVAPYVARIFYMMSRDGGVTWKGPTQVSDDAGPAQVEPSCATFRGVPFHVAWRDARIVGPNARSDIAYTVGLSNVLSFAWDPGDGSPTLGGVTVSHAYANPGRYVATLRVTDVMGASGDDALQVNVTAMNHAPVPDAGGPYAALEGETIVFDASRSTDADGDALSFSWDFDGDGSFESGPSDSPLATSVWGDDWTGTVRVAVSDGEATRIAKANVTVDNRAPAILDVQAYLGANVTLRVAGERWHDVRLDLVGNGQTTATERIVRTPGSPDRQSGTITGGRLQLLGTFAMIVYYTPADDPVKGQPNGANPVWVILTMPDGSEVRLHHTFNVQHPSTWVWTIDDVRPYLVNQKITFDATAHDVGSDDLTFAWDFGDGARIKTTFYNNGVSPDPYVSPEVNTISANDVQTHAFGVAGTHTVMLTVTDDDGGVAVNAILIVIGS